MRAIVIGGGGVGLAIANRLLDRGIEVQLVDATGPEPSASWGNAGHIAIEQVAPLASAATILGAPGRLLSPYGGLSLPLADVAAWAPFSWRLLHASLRYDAGKDALKSLLSQAAPAWERLAGALGKPHLVRRDGHFITWGTTTAAARGRKHWLSADVGDASIRDVTAEELKALRRVAPHTAGAVRCLGSGQISDPDTLLQALKARLAGEGRLVPGHVATASCDPANVLLSDGRRLEADCLIVAAGIGSRPLLEKLGFKVPMIAERGYHIQYEADGWPSGLPPVVFEDRAMIATRFDSLVRVAGFVEFGRPDSPADPRKWQRLARNAEELGLPLTQRISTWMGSRPTLPDYLPAIGKARPGLFYAFGHQHLGLTLAPVTGELVAALVAGETPAVLLTPFDLGRFRR